MEHFSFGKGEKTLVILPGASVKSVMLSAPAIATAYNCFADDYTVYVLECGEEINDGVSIEELADAVAAEMRRLGIEKADIFGCSLGGMIAQYIAINHAELVRSAILASTLCSHNEISSATCSEWCRLADSGDARALNKSVFSLVYSEAYYEKYRAVFESVLDSGEPEELCRFSAVIGACGRMDSREKLSKISCPVLVMGSYGDKALGPQGSIELAERLGCGLYMYSDYGHAVYDEAPDFRKRMMAFLAE